MKKPLTICLDARLHSGIAGGVETVIIGLAGGLGKLTDGDEHYLFLAWDGEDAWLRPYLGSNSSILSAGPAPQSRKRPAWVRWLGHQIASRFGMIRHEIPKSDGRIEASGADLMHFTKQNAFLTALPSIFHPHDLQHLHLPQFFTPLQRSDREKFYRGFCQAAKMVAVSSAWTRNDLILQYALPPEKVVDIPLAPICGEYPDTGPGYQEEIRRRLALPEIFLLYPAQTWAHKNHESLLRSVVRLRKKGLEIHYVFCGQENEYAVHLKRLVQRLGLERQVHWTGFVSPEDLIALYRLCRGTVVPSLFEAASAPLWEAFQLGVPAACSNVTSLPRQAKDAALVFDPKDPAQIDEAVSRLWTDPEERRRLSEAGLRRAGQFSWDLTSRIFRAHYRRLAGRELSPGDKNLIEAEPLL